MDKKDTANKVPIYKLTSKKEVLDYYTKWAANNQFNKDMIRWNYTAPVNAANLLNKHTVNKNINILDAGCGSGLVGEKLKKLGYTNIIGVDFSQDMLDLVKKEIYQHLELIDLNKNLKYQDNYFDAITCVGTFTYGHVKANALEEFIRITKQNGLICFTINEGIYTEYKFDKKIEELVKNNLWEILEFDKSSTIRESNLFTGKSLFGVIKIPILRIDMEIIVAKTANITFMFFLIYNLYKTMCSFLNLI